MAILEVQTPDGKTFEVDIGNNKPDSPQVQQILQQLSQGGQQGGQQGQPLSQPLTQPSNPREAFLEMVQRQPVQALRGAAVSGVGGALQGLMALEPQVGLPQHVRDIRSTLGHDVAESMIPKNPQELAKLGLLLASGPLAPASVLGKVGLGLGRAAVPAAVDIPTGNASIQTLIETGLVGVGELGTGAINTIASVRAGKAAIAKRSDEVASDIAHGVAQDVPLLGVGTTRYPGIQPNQSSVHDLFASEHFYNSRAARIIGEAYDRAEAAIKVGADFLQLPGVDTSKYPNLAKVVGEPTATKSGHMSGFKYERAYPSIDQVQQKLKETRAKVLKLRQNDPTLTAEDHAAIEAFYAAESEYKQWVGSISPQLAQRLESIQHQYKAGHFIHDKLSTEGVWRGTAKGPQLDVEKVQQLFGNRANDAEAANILNTLKATTGGAPAGAGDEVMTLSPRLSVNPMSKGYTGTTFEIPFVKPTGAQGKKIPAEYVDALSLLIYGKYKDLSQAP